MFEATEKKLNGRANSAAFKLVLPVLALAVLFVVMSSIRSQKSLLRDISTELHNGKTREYARHESPTTLFSQVAPLFFSY
jgi:hypothetical protein